MLISASSHLISLLLSHLKDLRECSDMLISANHLISLLLSLFSSTAAVSKYSDIGQPTLHFNEMQKI